MKRFLSLTALLLIAVASFAYDALVDGIYYDFSGSEATVTYFSSSYSTNETAYSGDITIPNSVTYNGTTYSVTSIGSYAFWHCTGLTSVTIPSSVTSIGSSAFLGCGYLTSITIPESVTTIGERAFCGCTVLKSITLPSSVTSIGSAAFTGCRGLTSISIPSSVTTIGENAFQECRGLTSITIPESVTTIGSSAFSWCTGLTSVTIPSSVTTIGENAFSDCTGLTNVTIPSSVTSIGFYAFSNTAWYKKQPYGLVYAGRVAYEYKGTMPENTSISIKEGTVGITDYAFYECTGLTSVTIPESVTTIGDHAFYDCTGLTSVTIPESVTSIGESAFKGCTGLTSVTIPSSVTTIGDDAFYGTAWYDNQPEGLVYAGKVAYRYKGTMPENTSITIKEGTLGIAGSAFYNRTGLTNVTIPSSVTSIGSSAFYGTAWYDNQPDGLVYAGNVAYKYKGTMPENTSISIKDGTLGIAVDAFSGCKGLTSITIPSSVTTIADEAFYGCTGLTSVYLDRNSFILLRLWNLSNSSSSLKDYLYDTTTGEKIELFETTASSIKVFNPEPKNYTITSKSLTIGGKSVELPYDVKGLAPNTGNNIVLTIKYKDNQGEDYTFTVNETVKTDALTLTTEQPKVVNEGNVIVSATTNVDPEEENVGFEWRREDWSSTFASQSGSAVILDGTMEGYIRNLYTGKLWNYRAYYLSNDGTYYYGDWVGIDPTNTSYFEPTVHTYADISTSGKVALIRGYVLNGTDKIKVQGFKYWKSASKSNSLDIDIEDEPQASAVTVPSNAMTETVDIVGAGQQKMNVTLDDLDYETTYYCVAFATTEENETFYGEVQTFTTDANPTGIEAVRAESSDNNNAEAVGFYTVNGQATNSLQKGLNIIRFSDGTTRKVMVK